MHTHYEDILSRVAEAPKWFDEYAVPRYVPFAPKEIAFIYADECALLEIRCQGCGQRFEVAMSAAKSQRFMGMARMLALLPDRLHDEVSKSIEAEVKNATLAQSITELAIHYGDPPNVNCCPAGPTMNSVPGRVLQYWRRGVRQRWERDAEFEIAIEPAWANDEEDEGSGAG